MEDFLRENILKYIKEKNENIKEDKVIIEQKGLGGMCNMNYLITIKDKASGNSILQLVFKKFGKISDCVDHYLETRLMYYLSEFEIGPKLLYEEEDYRIIEYISNSTNISKEYLFDEKILNQIYTIFNIYNLFTYTYRYHLDNDLIHLDIMLDNECKIEKEKVSKTFYENCTKNIYSKAMVSFTKFENQFRQNISAKDNTINYKTLAKFKYYLTNFHKLFNMFYPQEGFLVMSHNDVNRYNFIQKNNDKKLFIIDHEYASLNLPGYDIADYFNESNFHFVPEYSFSYENIDFDKYYGLYLKYINIFIKQHDFLSKEKNGNKFLEIIQTKRYYLSLHLIINYFWFLCCIIYLDFDTWKNGKKSSFQIANDLIRFLELAREKYENLNEN